MADFPAVSFEDHFSGHAAAYAAFRPAYPAGLPAFVATLPVPPADHRLAWDCATGNGQAAHGIVEFFARVIATDASPQQIAQAAPHPRIEYRVAPAESSGLADASVDLVTVAQALHWFDFDRFYAEVRRVLAPGGALAAWTYDYARISPEIDPLLDRLAHEVVGSYWPPGRRWVDEEYRTIPFPLDEIPTPPFELHERWPLERFAGYLRTWSAVQRYRAATGEDPVATLLPELAAAWGDPAAPRDIRWPIALRAGRP